MSEQIAPDRQRKGTLRVLIADDSAGIRYLLRRRLEGDGIEIVAEATNGQEAIEAVERLHPDLVVMDSMMPIMGGIEATIEIKRRWPEIDVLGYTSTPFSDSADQMLLAGASETFDKMHVEELADAVGRRIP